MDANTPSGGSAQATPLKPHPAAEIFPEMTSADFDALVDDIKQNGLLETIILHRGMILDGRHRYRACQRLGIKPETAEFADKDAVAFVIARNLRRRHLTSVQKREVIAKMLKLTPEKSNRRIAASVGVDHKTVQAVRSEAEDGGEIPHHVDHVGKDGVAQPARKKAKAKKKRPSVFFVDEVTGKRTPADLPPGTQITTECGIPLWKTPEAKPATSGFTGDPDVQAEADAAARDLEIERDERIALAGAEPLAKENEDLKRQIFLLDRRISALMSENASLKNEVRVWKTRAAKAGWKPARFDV